MLKIYDNLSLKKNSVLIQSMHVKCPNMELFVVCIFLYLDWLWRFTLCWVNLYIQSEYRKIWTRKNSVYGHFLCSEWANLVAKAKGVKIMNNQKQKPKLRIHWRLIFGNVICCSALRIWVGYSILNLDPCSFNGCSLV